MGDDLDSSVIQKTQECLGNFVKRPPLAEKHLRRPPFRFIHDIIHTVISTTGFFDGLYTEEELNAENIKDREKKIAFLQKAIDVIVTVTGRPLSVRPGKIVAGQEAEKTNEFLQAIGTALQNGSSSTSAVQKVLSTFSSGEIEAPVTAADETNHVTNGTDEIPIISQEAPKKSKKPEVNGTDKKASNVSKQKEQNNAAGKKTTAAATTISKDSRSVSKDRTKSDEKSKTSSTSKNAKPPSTTAAAGDAKPTVSRKSSKEVDSKQPKVNSKSRTETDKSKTSKEDKTRKPVKALPDGKDGSKQHLRAGRDLAANRDISPTKNKSGPAKTSSRSNGKSSERKLERKGTFNAGDRKEKPEKDDDQEVPDDEVVKISEKKGSPTEKTRSSTKTDGTGDTSENRDGDGAVSVMASDHPVARQPSAMPRATTARPISARPAPPKIRTRETHIQEPPRPESVLPVNNVITEGDTSNQNDVNDDQFVLEESPTNILEQEIEQPATDMSEMTIEEGKHGSLVQKILDTRKDLESSILGNKERVPGETTILSEATRRKERENLSKELDKVRTGVQSLTRTAAPLGKLLDFVGEDVESMVLEINTWRNLSEKYRLELESAQKSLDAGTQPLQLQLEEANQLVAEEEQRIANVKAQILRHEEKIKTLLSSDKQRASAKRGM